MVKRGLKSMIEATDGNPAAKEEKLKKDDKLFGSPNKKARFTVGPEDLKYGTEAGKRFKAGNPNYKMRESLESTGKFTAEEIDKILEADSLGK